MSCQLATVCYVFQRKRRHLFSDFPLFNAVLCFGVKLDLYVPILFNSSMQRKIINAPDQSNCKRISCATALFFFCFFGRILIPALTEPFEIIIFFLCTRSFVDLDLCLVLLLCWKVKCFFSFQTKA